MAIRHPATLAEVATRTRTQARCGVALLLCLFVLLVALFATFTTASPSVVIGAALILWASVVGSVAAIVVGMDA